MLGKFHFKFEPSAWSEVVRQGMYLALIFELVKWTETQQVAVLMFVSALLALITRSLSTPTAASTTTSKTPPTLPILLLAGSLALGSAGACVTTSTPPPNLSPAAVTAFENLQVQKNLDLVRDMAISANEAKLLSTDATRQVVLWHRAGISALHARTGDWRSKISDGARAMQSAESSLTGSEKTVLGPYLDLVLKTLGGQ